MDKDKKTEYQRYDARARAILSRPGSVADGRTFGASAIPLTLRAPYLYFEQCIHKYISSNHDVLEIGSGTGLHTHKLVETGARVTASDISIHSLSVLERCIKGITTVTADMEALPF